MKAVVVATFLFLFASTPLTLWAQSEGTFRGLVTAEADGSVLAEATIRLTGPALLQTTSGADGSFTFRRVVPGTYTLVAAREGFRDERLQFTLKPRQTLNLTLELSVMGVAQSIEVQATPTIVSSTYSPSSTSLEGARVADFPLDQRNSLTEVMALTVPGSSRSHDDFVHVRGQEIALNTFINGVSFWENPHSVLSSGLSPDIIQSANVMTGGFPAEYGNRFGGVVDIVTKSGLALDNRGSLTLGVGTALRHNAAVEYGGHTDRVGYYVYSAGFESARFLSPNDPRSIHDTGRGSHNFVQFDFSPADTDSLKLVLMGDGTNFQIPKTSIDDQYRPNLDASERTRGQTAILTWSHAPRGNTLVTTSLYERWSRMVLLPSAEPLAAVASNERRLSTTGLRSDVTRILGEHTLKGGIDLVMLRPEESLYFDGDGYVMFSDLMGLPAVELAGPNGEPIALAERKRGAEGSIYVQDTFQATRNLTADLGVRFDRYSLAMSDSHLSPRVNVSYRFGESGMVLHASYDHFFVPPAIENVLISSAGLTRFLEEVAEPLPPLRPVVEDQFETGVSRRFGGHIRLGVTGYYRSSDHPVHTVLFPDSRIYAYANFLKGKAYGMEIKTEIPVIERLGVSGYLNYALSRVYFWNPVTAGFVDEPDHLEEAGRFLAPMDQTHTLNAGFVYRRSPNGFWTAMNFEYGSGTPTESAAGEEAPTPLSPEPDLRVPGHFTADLTVGADVLSTDATRIGLQLNVENLTNNVYKVSQESTFSPGEYFHPRFYSASLKLSF